MMESSPASNSDQLAGAFDRLDPEIQRWIYQKGWSELREVQALAIDAILASNSDVVISAATAAGKTEAAFLPILTEIVADTSETSANDMEKIPVPPVLNLPYRAN
jgi:ATP-dependent helicase Lhr and Lhr-like helicase